MDWFERLTGFPEARLWIDAAMRRGLALMRDFQLDVRVVSFGTPPPSMVPLERDFR